MKGIKLIVLAIIVTVILVPLGVIWNILKAIYNFFMYWINIFYQAWLSLVFWVKAIPKTESFDEICFVSAMALDYMWNATSGELIEDIVTTEERTLFGKGEVTVSAATGRQQVKRKLTPTGEWFSGMLNKVFNEEAHCVDSWLKVRDDHLKS